MFFSTKSSPELISLHIPKTAGTSFRNILKNVYGDDQVVRLDISDTGIVRLNESLYDSKQLQKVKVIHGHFYMQSLKDKFAIPKDCKIITWVRDPVKRVISNFLYLESRLIELLEEEKNNLNILSKMQRTLIEYARADINRNIQSKHLAGCNLLDYNFIGVQEFFDQEILRLSDILSWKKTPTIVHHNKTPDTGLVISDGIIAEIMKLNIEDIDLYNEALRIRHSMLNQ